jgi:hypothetical protein
MSGFVLYLTILGAFICGFLLSRLFYRWSREYAEIDRHLLNDNVAADGGRWFGAERPFGNAGGSVRHFKVLICTEK